LPRPKAKQESSRKFSKWMTEKGTGFTLAPMGIEPLLCPENGFTLKQKV